MSKICRAILLGLLLSVTATALASETEINWERAQREALDLFIKYLKIDTTNPPGNEIRAAQFFADICQREGIEHQVFEPYPGRGTLWARVRGDGSKRPLILLNHTDVVPHSPEFWTAPAFGGEIKDGFIYGRGAMDMKSLGIAQFITLLAFQRVGKRAGDQANGSLKRDVIFLATADEEAGGLQGAGWFAKNHPELIADAEFLFNEGGNNVVDAKGKVLAVGVGPAEKTPAWLRLTTTGEPGHGSVPRPNSAVNRLLRALNKLLDYEPSVQLTSSVEQAFRAMAPLMTAGAAEKYANFREAIKDPVFLKQVERDPGARALLRNTISVTILSGSNKVNVIPPSAYAEIDTRIVPGEKLDRWINELRGVIKDDSIKIEPVLAFAANASPVDTDLVKIVGEVVKRQYPGAVITYPVLAGFTDSHFFRDLGVHSYGFSPFIAPAHELGGGFHGNDERIGQKVFVDGVRLFYEVAEQLAK